MNKVHIWNECNPFFGKVNFIDSNNTIIGYDMNQNCCEHASWSISPNKDGSLPIHIGDDTKGQEISIDNYIIDPRFNDIDDSVSEEAKAIFKMVCYKQPDLYIILSNCHNGYYSHGFVFKGEKEIITGDI